MPAPESGVAVLAGPGVLDDERTAREILARAAAACGRAVDLRVAADLAELTAWARDRAGTSSRVLWPGPEVAVADLLGPPDPTDPAGGPDPVGRPAPGAGRLVRVDATLSAPDRDPRLARHVRGRGIAGLAAAVAALDVAERSPAEVVNYGDHPDQRAELRLPPGASTRHPVPVLVLVHGGYWRPQWENDLMEPLALDALARGWASWNLEYRRPHAVGEPDAGWAGTAADVAAGHAALARAVAAGAPIDPDRVVLVGHSAGGQLVTRLAADLVRSGGPVPRLTVSLAGVLDLVVGHERGLGNGAVPLALGGPPAELPDVYRESSPRHRLPLGAETVVVCGTRDDPDLLDVSRSWARAARAAGDRVHVVEEEADHFDVIDPTSAVWAGVTGIIAEVVAEVVGRPAQGPGAP
ncbi:alpha/beta hydrolase [Kineococcus gynurae]|uniref:Alpha/beta hydrolase n=1 Tax=Kineococcus gynurae TaxID=452979 RepID=A0ABV5LQZ7_9ACTN